jgi:uncharacterized membrane protein
MTAEPTKPPENISLPRGWLHPVALARGLMARPKLYWSIAAGVTALLLAPDGVTGSARAVLAWDTGAVVYLSLAVHLFSTCELDEIKERATTEDETRFVFAAVILMAVISSLAAVFGLIGEAHSAKGAQQAGYLLLGGMAVILSWLILQTIFTLHYAHDYYRPAANQPTTCHGLRFPDDDKPDYWDFFYFATSIGATSQTSDVSIVSKSLRRTVALHAVLAFVFNTAVVAFSINLAASLVQH